MAYENGTEVFVRGNMSFQGKVRATYILEHDGTTWCVVEMAGGTVFLRPEVQLRRTNPGPRLAWDGPAHRRGP